MADSELGGKLKILSSGCDTVTPGPGLALACFCIALEPGRVFPFLNVVKKRKEDSRLPAKPGLLGSGLWEESSAGRAHRREEGRLRLEGRAGAASDINEKRKHRRRG